MIASPLGVFLTLAGVVWFANWLETRFLTARALGALLLGIVIAAIIANLGFLPARSATYDMLGGIGVNLGIALILLGVDVRSIARAGPRMLAAFGLGAVGTVAGAIGGALLLAPQIGPETWKVAGQYTGTYIGGGVNMVSVGRSLETSAELFSAAVAADNVTTALWMVACFAAPVVLARWWGVSGADATLRVAGVQEREESPASRPADASPAPNAFVASTRPVSIRDVAALGVLASGAVWLADRVGGWVPGIPTVLWLTTIVLLVAQIGAVRRLAGGPMLGNYALQLFLVGLGAQSLIGEIVRVGPAVFWFTLVVVGVHGLLVFGVGRLARLDLPTLAVASQANVGGPASAMAIATARGYPDRLLPGIAVGLLGYAVGNYAGFAVAGLLKGWIG